MSANAKRSSRKRSAARQPLTPNSRGWNEPYVDDEDNVYFFGQITNNDHERYYEQDLRRRKTVKFDQTPFKQANVANDEAGSSKKRREQEPEEENAMHQNTTVELDVTKCSNYSTNATRGSDCSMDFSTSALNDDTFDRGSFLCAPEHAASPARAMHVSMSTISEEVEQAESEVVEKADVDYKANNGDEAVNDEQTPEAEKAVEFNNTQQIVEPETVGATESEVMKASDVSLEMCGKTENITEQHNPEQEIVEQEPAVATDLEITESLDVAPELCGNVADNVENVVEQHSPEQIAEPEPVTIDSEITKASNVSFELCGEIEQHNPEQEVVEEPAVIAVSDQTMTVVELDATNHSNYSTNATRGSDCTMNFSTSVLNDETLDRDSFVCVAEHTTTPAGEMHVSMSVITEEVEQLVNKVVEKVDMDCKPDDGDDAVDDGQPPEAEKPTEFNNTQQIVEPEPVAAAESEVMKAPDVAPELCGEIENITEQHNPEPEEIVEQEPAVITESEIAKSSEVASELCDNVENIGEQQNAEQIVEPEPVAATDSKLTEASEVASEFCGKIEDIVEQHNPEPKVEEQEPAVVTVPDQTTNAELNATKCSNNSLNATRGSDCSLDLLSTPVLNDKTLDRASFLCASEHNTPVKEMQVSMSAVSGEVEKVDVECKSVNAGEGVSDEQKAEQNAIEEHEPQQTTVEQEPEGVMEADVTKASDLSLDLLSTSLLKNKTLERASFLCASENNTPDKVVVAPVPYFTKSSLNETLATDKTMPMEVDQTIITNTTVNMDVNMSLALTPDKSINVSTVENVPTSTQNELPTEVPATEPLPLKTPAKEEQVAVSSGSVRKQTPAQPAMSKIPRFAGSSRLRALKKLESNIMPPAAIEKKREILRPSKFQIPKTIPTSRLAEAPKSEIPKPSIGKLIDVPTPIKVDATSTARPVDLLSTTIVPGDKELI